MRLRVPEHLKNPNTTYRWVNVTQGGRVDALHAKDWDVVQGIEQRSVSERTPLKAVLMEKPLDWHQEDQERKNVKRKGMEDTMKRGATPMKEGFGQGESYVPQGHANVIG